MCLHTADGPADETNVTLTITNTSAEFTKLGRCAASGMLLQLGGAAVTLCGCTAAGSACH